MLLLIIKERWSLGLFFVGFRWYLSPVLRNHLKPRSQKHVLDSFSQGMRSKTRWHCEIRRVTDVNRHSGTFCRLHTCTYRGRVSALRIQMSWSLLENHEQIAEPQHLQRPVIVKLRLVKISEVAFLFTWSGSQKGTTHFHMPYFSPVAPTVSALHLRMDSFELVCNNTRFITEDVEAERDKETGPKYLPRRWQSPELRCHPSVPLDLFCIFIVVPWGLCFTFLG